MQLWLALRRPNPGLAEHEVRAALPAGLDADAPSTRAEVRRISRVDWAEPPLDAVRRRVRGPAAVVGGEAEWTVVFLRHMERFGGPASALADLTMGQLRVEIRPEFRPEA